MLKGHLRGCETDHELDGAHGGWGAVSGHQQ